MTWSAVQEGLFLYTHNVSPYDGGVFYQVRSIQASKLPDNLLTAILGASTPSTFRTHTFRPLLNHYGLPLHSSRPALRRRTHTDRRIRGVRVLTVVSLAAKEHQVGQCGGRSSVSRSAWTSVQRKLVLKARTDISSTRSRSRHALGGQRASLRIVRFSTLLSRL